MKLDELPAFSEDLHGAVHVVVETPRGAGIKFRYDPKLRVFLHGHALPSGLSYPHDWGFIPSTLADDGDPLDALVLSDCASYPGVVIPTRLVGVIRLSQRKDKGRGRERNDRIIGVPEGMGRFEGMRDASDLPRAVREELAHFFLDTTFFTPKDARVEGWKGAAAAMKLVEKACRRYRER